MGAHHHRSSSKPRRASGGDGEAGPDLDVLSDALRQVRLTGALFFVIEASSPWVAEAPRGDVLAPVILPGAGHVISYHLVLSGACWCGVPGEPPVRLAAGDVLVIPRGDPYVMSTRRDAPVGAAPEAVLDGFRQLAARALPFVLLEGGGGPERLRVACGFLGCDALPFNPVVAALPRVLRMPRSGAGREARLGPLLELALAEARAPRAGSACVLLRISELMFVEIVRDHLASLPADHAGWLAGLRDPAVGRALALLHQRPAHPWTLARLARAVGCSRSTLAERFSHFVGQPPMGYLARWRMQLAARRLADDAAKVAAVAVEAGYESEAAFSRAFKRIVGVPPGAWRARRA